MKINEKKNKRFFVYPEKKETGFNVYIWVNKLEMRKYLNSRNPHEDVQDIVACVLWNAKDENEKIIGEMHFNQECLSIETIIHETFHATFRWARYKQIKTNLTYGAKLNFTVEDKIAYAGGRLVKQIQRKLKKLNLPQSENA